jgi:hypothetical protein
MQKWLILASVVVLAAGSANCSSSREPGASGSILAPSELGEATTAAKGGNKPPNTSSGSLTLVMVTDTNANGLPNWGDSVTFDVSQTATTEPHVDLTCSQNGAVVYSATTGFYASYPWPWTNTMKLSSTSWQSGAADCVAQLYYFSGTKKVTLASLSFTANP